jgi:hypothetical protein
LFWPEDETDWDDLAPHRQQHYQKFGWTKERWDSIDNSAGRQYGAVFNPEKVSLSVPELERIDFEYLAELLSTQQVELRVGDSIGDDEYPPREYMPMRDYLSALQKGSKLYLKYEGGDALKESLHSTIGLDILNYLVVALDGAGLLPSELCTRKEDMWFDKWTFWVGGTNTSTGMHYDDDEFAFLYVATGRKRIVLIPNDETRAYTCETHIEGHSCWTGVDILNGPPPPYAIEFELGPGEGIAIPAYAWHAVQNLEPTIAFGLLLDEEDFC